MSEKKQSYFESLLDSYYEGTITEQQRKLLDRFFEDQYTKVDWNTAAMGDRDQLKKTIQKKIHQRTKKKIFKLTPVYYAAASIALLFGLFFYLKKDVGNLQFTTTTQIDSLQLEDGSKIILSPNSIFEYPEKFDSDQREVRLIKGNAFFKVARDTVHPFMVTQGKLTTRVLGTSFNIRITSLGTTVDVKTGKVAVSTETGQRQVITENQRVVFNLEKESLHLKELSDLPHWYGSNIALHNIDMWQLSRFLELRFGYKLRLTNNELHENKLTVNISKTDNIHSVIEQLNYITNLQFKINAHEISVH